MRAGESRRFGFRTGGPTPCSQRLSDTLLMASIAPFVCQSDMLPSDSFLIRIGDPIQHPVSSFIDRNFRHFNAAALKDAADAYVRHIDGGGAMFVTLAGAMSTAELGLSLAEMIRQDK